LVLLSQRFKLQNLGGVQVSGAVGVWFLIAGLTWLGVLARLSRPTLRAVGLGVLLFVILWIAFGALAQMTWLHVCERSSKEIEQSLSWMRLSGN
jgi:hypothetical protein